MYGARRGDVRNRCERKDRVGSLICRDIDRSSVRREGNDRNVGTVALCYDINL